MVRSSKPKTLNPRGPARGACQSPLSPLQLILLELIIIIVIINSILMTVDLAVAVIRVCVCCATVLGLCYLLQC